MKSTKIISLSVLGLLMCTPLLASAEEAAGGAGGVVTPPTPPATVDSWSFGASNPQMPPGGMGSGRESPSKPSLGSVKSPRDSASGQATGKRMMASGTKPLPPGIERELEKRDHMMASGTPMGDRKDKMEERRDEMKDRMQERKSEMLKRMAHQMIERMKAAIARLTKLADRVDSRIAKLKTKGVDTSKAEAAIAIARGKIADATTAVGVAEGAVAAAVANADTTTGTSTPGSDAGKPVREALEKARVAVVDAHKALVDAIEALKANVKTGVENHGSSTAPVTN